MNRVSDFANDGWGLLSLDWLVMTAVLMMTAASVIATGAGGIDLSPVGSAEYHGQDAEAASRSF